MRWLQIRGDPSVRQFVFDQERVANEFDAHIEEVFGWVECLLREHGVFHAKLHFSSGQVTLWLLHDPLRYRVHLKEEFLDSGICLAYPRARYTDQATVPMEVIPWVLAEFKRLRSLDRNIYLRSASLNVVNGLVGLNFSCDGSHYLGYTEFLDRAGELYA
jgi:hypothetical protein